MVLNIIPDLITGAVDDTFGAVKEIYEIIVELTNLIFKMLNLIPSIIELLEIIIKAIIVGVDVLEDAYYILPPFLVLYTTKLLIEKYEYGK